MNYESTSAGQGKGTHPGFATPKRPPQPTGFRPKWMRELSPIELDTMPESMVGQGINDEPVEIEYHI